MTAAYQYALNHINDDSRAAVTSLKFYICFYICFIYVDFLALFPVHTDKRKVLKCLDDVILNLSENKIQAVRPHIANRLRRIIQ